MRIVNPAFIALDFNSVKLLHLSLELEFFLLPPHCAGRKRPANTPSEIQN